MSSFLTKVELRAAIEEVVYRNAMFLDELRFKEWLAATAAEFRYRIQAYSPELRKDMVWLDHDRAGMAALIELLPKHHVDRADWFRHVVLNTVTPRPDGSVESVSSFAIFHTIVDVGDVHVEGGQTRLFAVGRYHDRFRSEGGEWLLSERVVKLHTRQLGLGSHLFP